MAEIFLKIMEDIKRSKISESQTCYFKIPLRYIIFKLLKTKEKILEAV